MLLDLPHVAALAVLLTPALSCVLNSTEVKELFGPHLSPGAGIFFPTDANYTSEVIQRSSAYTNPTYFASIKPVTAADVQAIVRIASQNDVPFLATGGGHGGTITTKSLNGIQIDLSNLKNVTLDDKSNLLTIGGGVIFEDIFPVLFAAGKELQAPSASCVGVLGATLGGGIGRLQGLHGLVLDSLQSVEIVTATGDLITASKKENADLFWGLRGAGFNFGIVTSATYKVANATNSGKFLSADFGFLPEKSTKYFEILKSFDYTLPAGLSLTSSIRWNATANSAYVYLNAVFAGPEDEGLAHLKPFTALGPFLSGHSMVDYPKINQAAFFGQGDSDTCQGPGKELLSDNFWGLGVKKTDVPTLKNYFSKVNALYKANPALQGLSTTLQRFPHNAVMANSGNFTSYPDIHREIIMHFLFINIYNITDPILDGNVTTWMLSTRDLLSKTSGFADLEIYDNYAHGNEGPVVWYTEESLERLIPLKQRWDPKKLFSWTNPIPN
ncbi:hypothetical protein F5884DRAFT_117923 [Xylogone sp. PMI_703]|nr:hypothetical protein F5884DRAFT_117923 [Xylogone sp. PMI_703]